MIDSENVRAYVERMASSAPAPGGGAAGALQAGLGAALVAMSARYTTAPEQKSAAERTARRADELLPAALHLADADAAAFGALSEAYALPQDTEQQRSRRSSAVQEATVGAAQPPYRLVGVGCEVFELARDLTQWCNPNVLSDVAAAVEATRAAVATALLTLESNLRSIEDPAARKELEAQRSRAEHTVAEATRLAGRIRERIRD